ncbi:MAG: rod shape-determining protein RodA [Candidatus Marinimicrobia bacterium]|nr:rod shape-determining protein RodA [Candidatus Neomarinimicrobiota bacterium]MBL7010056.1 rod shape-determining protein RodA [Candidatus Neomarinimicrobiota bacterium]MBL7030325.1 rod shape-determining protein RodA [Candidatus Neomarinimicrobiota bacterium]
MLLDFRKKIIESPYSVLLSVGGLLLLGLSTLFSITATQGQPPPNALSKQLIFLVPALILMFIMLMASRRVIHKYIFMVYGIIVIAVTLPFFGEKIAGTYRWINLGLPFGLQPSEIAKWVIVIALARYLSDHNLKMKNFGSNIIPFIIALIPTVIVLSQPDLGTAFVMMIPVFTMLFWVGARPIHLFLIMAPLFSILTAFNVIVFSIWAAIMAGVIFLARLRLWHAVGLYFGNIFLGLIFPLLWNSLRPYQQNRILTLVNPELDPLGAGYQIIQSKTALGSGGFLGKGWGQGTQTHLKFLPVQESDFIVSVIGEEFGFLTLIIMLVLFSWLIIKIIRLALNSTDRFSSLVLVGISTIFLSHVFVNCAMTAGMIPVKGLPLPFVSYGGSFLLSCFMMIGLVLNFGREKLD